MRVASIVQRLNPVFKFVKNHAFPFRPPCTIHGMLVSFATILGQLRNHAAITDHCATVATMDQIADIIIIVDPVAPVAPVAACCQKLDVDRRLAHNARSYTQTQTVQRAVLLDR